MQKPNVLLVVLDATRFDYCSCYGYRRATTPALDRLAEEGTLFENAIAPAPWTLPAFASIFTGLFPSQTGIYTTRRLSPEYTTIAGVLAEHGYRSFIATSNSWLSPDFGLVHDFDTVHKLWQIWQAEDDVTSVNVIQRAGADKNIYLAAIQHYLFSPHAFQNIINYFYYHVSQRVDMGASRILKPFKRWVSTQTGPWFAVLHYMEAHLPYQPPRAWWQRFARDPEIVQRLRTADQRRLFWRHNAGVEQLSTQELEAWQDLYAAEIAYQDAHLGRLLEWLRETDQYDSTCIIVVGDHGENLGEHGLLNHQYCLYETLIHVPLVIRYPPIFRQSERVQTPVSTLDIYRTIMNVTGVTSPCQEDYSLIPGSKPRPFIISEYGAPSTPPRSVLSKYGLLPQHLQRFERGLTSLRTERYKMIVGTDGTHELYDLHLDPGEMEDISAHRPKLVEELKNQLQVWWQQHDTGPIGQPATTVKVDPVIAERLRALGYLE